MTKDEALKLALEALVLNNAEWKHLADSGDSGDWSAEDQDHYKQTEEAITAIKEALGQPEQEPVTWRYKIVDVFGRPVWTLKTPKSDTRVLESQPLYTTPPQRKPLTDEELRVIENKINPNMRWRSSDEEGITLYPIEYYELVRAIEAAHGIKGKA